MAVEAFPVKAPNKLVPVMEVAKKLVEVAFVEVELPLIKRLPLMVDEAFEMKPWKRPRVVVVETPQV